LPRTHAILAFAGQSDSPEWLDVEDAGQLLAARADAIIARPKRVSFAEGGVGLRL
jgi:hypothetical protein